MPCCYCGCSAVIGLDPANGDYAIAPTRHSVCNKKLQLSHL